MIFLNQAGLLPKINPVDVHSNIYIAEGDIAYNTVDLIFYVHKGTTLLSFSYAVIIASQTHNNLLGLQGGVLGQYYHLTLAQLNSLIAVPTTYLVLNGSNQVSWTPTNVLVSNLNADLLDGLHASSFVSAGSAWNILGNVGTVDGTNFIGTTDDIPLTFRVNNIKSGRIDDNGSTYFGYAAGFSDVAFSNTGFGFNVLNSNLGGDYNTAIGYCSLFSNITGSNCIGIGNYAGNYTQTDFNRLYINSIDRINLLGDQTLSIIYGIQAATTSNQHLYLNANTYISNTLQVGLLNTTLGTIGLYGSTSGLVTIQPKAIAGTWNLTLPDSGGTNTYFLQTDGSGITTWAAALTSVTPHNILSATHGDTLIGSVLDGDVIIGNVTPKWSRLGISIPATNVLRNVLGIDNGELRPSWKATLDATNPTTIGISNAASPGISLIYSHRDHQHASPATWTPSSHTHNSHTSLDVAGNHAKLIPSVNSTTAIQLCNVAGTGILVVDSTNSRVAIGTEMSPSARFHVPGTTAAHYIQTDVGLNLNFVLPPTPVSAVDGGAVGLLNGTYYYNVTFYTALGETQCTTTASIAVVNRKVTVNIPVSTDYRVIGRKLYRNKAASPYPYNDYTHASFIIANNIDVTFLDNIADGSLIAGSGYYRLNTTNNYICNNGIRILAAGSDTTLFGVNAGAGLTSGYGTFIGADAGKLVTSGTQLTFVGYACGTAITSATHCTAMGDQALSGMSTGFGGTAFGSWCLRGSTGDNNTGVGTLAGLSISSGAGNTTIGTYSLYTTTTTNYNTMVGAYSGYFNNKASCTAIGYEALIGVNTAGVTTTGSTVSGYFAGAYALGNYNSYYGFEAGKSANASTSTNTYNAAYGYQSLVAITTGNHNTCFGNYTGTTLTTQTNNCYFGEYAGYYETGSSKLFIDNQTRTNEATARYSSLIYGVFNATVLSQQLYLNCKVSINPGGSTVTPTAYLHIAAGTNVAGTSPLKFTAGTLLAALELGALEFTDDGTNGHLYITRNLAGVLTRTLIV